MRKFPPRKLHGEGDPDLIARHAWDKMKRGVSLADCAYHVRMTVGELDLIMWRWCCNGRGKPQPIVKTPSPLDLREFSWE